jgi:two-component system chemotaxis response regulator CheB
MEIVLTRGDREGHVFIEDGEVIHAETGDTEGEQAFYTLMQWREGTFTTRQCAAFPVRTIQSSVMSLLMEGARLADEQGEG